jgi:serine/threonine-protein kinase
MLAALNHPNIATIYGLENSNGTHFLIMELVSGETLAERIKRECAVPVEEALKIAVQIAEALEAAHEKGIIHRDLKPANVKVTLEGKVKVLDFGLAKAFAGEVASSDPSDSPTLSRAATMQGVILGTAAYMSPEQARGKSVDKRTDIWAFGCVLYELLTGKQAFDGEGTTDILAAVVRAQPDWDKLPPSTPMQIRTLLKRCLQKEKALRLQAAGDARIEIQEAQAAPVQAEPRNVGASRLASWRLPVLLTATALVAAAAAGFAVWNLKPTPSARSVTRTVITLPQGQQLAGLENGVAVALSPDGTHLAYVARQGGGQQLYLRAMDSDEARPISGTEGATTPFFSPDGQWLGFFANGKLKKVSLNGVAAVSLADASGARGASWGSQGMIAFSLTPISPLQQVSDGGGAPQPLTLLKKGENSHGWPEFLPSGKAVLFAAAPGTANWTNAQVVAQSLRTGERRNLIQGATHPRYAPSGHLIYAQGGSLMAVPFDPQRLTVTGAAVPAVEGVLQSPTDGDAEYSFSATGSLVYVSGSVQGAQSKLVLVDRRGVEQPLAAPARAYLSPRLSPDGRRVAVGVTELESQTWLYDFARETLTRLTFEGNSNQYPTWTPDGKRIAFRSNKEGPLNLFWQLADGSGGLERLTTSETPRLRTPGPRMGKRWPSWKSQPRQESTSGCCG